MRQLAVLLLLAVPACAPAAPPAAGPDAATHAAVMAPVQRLFDAMRAGDSATVRAVFHPAATLGGVGVRDGRPFFRSDPQGLNGFVAAVGAPHDQVWDERIWDPVVQVDGELATVWVPYAFYLGDTLSHCGVDAIELFRGDQGWQIVHLADTRRREGCVVPAYAK